MDFDGVVDGDIGPSVLFKKTKTHKERRVPLSGRALEALRRIQVKTLTDAGPYVLAMRNNVTRRWKRILTMAGVSYARVHDMRATFITRAIRAGTDVETVRDLAGHTKTETTLKYYTAATTPKSKRAAIDAMAAVG